MTWRKAIVKETSESRVRVSYVGWGADWDEVIDLKNEPNRIRLNNTTSEIVSQRKTGADSSSRRRKSLNNNSLPAQFVIPEAVTTSESEDSFDENTIPANIDDTGHMNMNSQDSIGTDSDSLITRYKPTKSVPRRQTGLSKKSSGSKLERRPTWHRRQSFPSRSNSISFELAWSDRMATQGLHVVEVGGDGNCLFRAIAHQVYLDESRHSDLRAMTCDHLKKHRKRFKVFCATDFDS